MAEATLAGGGSNLKQDEHNGGLEHGTARRVTGRLTALGDFPLKLTAWQRFVAKRPRRTMADTERQQKKAKH